MTVQPTRPATWPAFRCTPRGDIGYSLKTPYRDGTTHVIFEPLDFIARLAAKSKTPAPAEDRTPAEQQAAMRWAQRLKRVFQVDVETCPICGGKVKVIASIEDPPIIERILRHLAGKYLPGQWPESRAPPVRVQHKGRPAARTSLPH